MSFDPNTINVVIHVYFLPERDVKPNEPVFWRATVNQVNRNKQTGSLSIGPVVINASLEYVKDVVIKRKYNVIPVDKVLSDMRADMQSQIAYMESWARQSNENHEMGQ